MKKNMKNIGYKGARTSTPVCTCGSSKGICKKCATKYKGGKPGKTESMANQVVNRLLRENMYAMTDEQGMSSELPVGHDHEETDMTNPEERTEVEIAYEIIDVLDDDDDELEMDDRHNAIRDLANEILAMHGQENDGMEDDYDEGPGSVPMPELDAPEKSRLGEATRLPTKMELTDPQQAYNYALNVIKGPWREGEAVIATDPNWSHQYVKNVLRTNPRPTTKGASTLALSQNSAKRLSQWASPRGMTDEIDGEPESFTHSQDFDPHGGK